MGFIGGICLPCYDLLVQVLPNTEPMQKQCKDNLETWKELAEIKRAQANEAKQEVSEKQVEPDAEAPEPEADVAEEGQGQEDEETVGPGGEVFSDALLLSQPCGRNARMPHCFLKR